MQTDRTRNRRQLTGLHQRMRVHKIKPSWVWWASEDRLYAQLLEGYALHVCCGHSQIGDIRVDVDPTVKPDIVADMYHLPFRRGVFKCAIIDPPWEQWDFSYLYIS